MTMPKVRRGLEVDDPLRLPQLQPSGFSGAWLLPGVWRQGRAGLPLVRVGDLKHTFGRRLRAAGVGFEDCQDLLAHYSAVERSRLIEAAERVTVRDGTRPELVVLRGAIGIGSRKTPASTEGGVRGAL